MPRSIAENQAKQGQRRKTSPQIYQPRHCCQDQSDEQPSGHEASRHLSASRAALKTERQRRLSVGKQESLTKEHYA
jgi:hypothetical protein